MSTRLHTLKSLRSDESGNVSIIFTLMVFVLLGFIGGAIDYARYNHVYDRTSSAMDAALLNAGRILQTESNAEDKALSTAQLYFDEQIKGRLEVESPTSEFSIGADGMSIIGKASGQVRTPFMGFVNTYTLPLNIESKANLAIGGSGNSDLELSLMLDVTGSMCDGGEGPCKTGSKIDAMKAAAKDLIDIVLKQNVHGGDDMRVAVVPFATRVRVANEETGNIKNMMRKLTNLDDKWTGWYKVCTESSGIGASEGEGNWSCSKYDSQYKKNWEIAPCVTDRSGPQQFTDATPSANNWLNAHDGTRKPVSMDSSDTPIAAGAGTGLTKADPSDQWNYGEDIKDQCADMAAENVIMPLEADKDKLKAHIDGLTAYGATGGALGTAWSWYAISPNFDNVFKSESRPHSYALLSQTNPNGTPKLKKIAVLMTDGLYNTYRGWKGADPVMVSNNAKSICTNMKAEGIEIFTVGFDLDKLSVSDRTRAEDVLKSCGTDISHFYDAVDPENLKQSFRDIALKLSQLYIAK